MSGPESEESQLSPDLETPSHDEEEMGSEQEKVNSDADAIADDMVNQALREGMATYSPAGGIRPGMARARRLYYEELLQKVKGALERKDQYIDIEGQKRPMSKIEQIDVITHPNGSDALILRLSPEKKEL